MMGRRQNPRLLLPTNGFDGLLPDTIFILAYLLSVRRQFQPRQVVTFSLRLHYLTDSPVSAIPPRNIPVNII
jgi:hypothetical protein